MIKVRVIRDNKSFEGTMDMDSDIFTKVPICNKLSVRIVPEDGQATFYVTVPYDLFLNYKEVQITKMKQ